MDEPFARQSAYVRWEIANLTKQSSPQGAAEWRGSGRGSGRICVICTALSRRSAEETEPDPARAGTNATLAHPERRRIVRELRDVISPRRAETLANATAVSAQVRDQRRPCRGRITALRRHQGFSRCAGSRIQFAATSRLQRQDEHGEFRGRPGAVPGPRVRRSGFLDGYHGTSWSMECANIR